MHALLMSKGPTTSGSRPALHRQLAASCIHCTLTHAALRQPPRGVRYSLLLVGTSPAAGGGESGAGPYFCAALAPLPSDT
jgi:hypothetical protein